MTTKIFVFGSNREGRHGKGAALEAKRHYGAIYGRPRGLQGRSYAIITKELRRDYPAVTLQEVKVQVDQFLDFARQCPHYSFVVSPIGCGLAGFKPEQIGPLFKGHPDNVHLPEQFIPYAQ